MALYAYGFTLARSLPAGLIGVAGGEVACHAIGPVSAIVETLDPAAFQRLVEAHQDDRPWLLEHTTRHDLVLRAFLDDGVVPLRFGTVVADIANLEAWLGGQGDVEQRLHGLRGCAEWTVRLWLDSEGLQGQVSSGDVEAQRAKAGAGTRYLLERQRALALESRLPALAQQQREVWAQKLNSQVRDLRVLTRLPGARRGLVPLLEAVALTLSAHDWSACQLEWQCGDVHVELSGPFAPYHFASPEETP